MKWSYKILRAILVSLLTLMILLPTTLYIVMTLPPIQNKVKEISEEELHKLLNANIHIGSVTLSPFDRVTLRNIVIEDNKGDTAAYIRRLGAGINLRELIKKQNIEINYAELIGLDARIYKSNPDAPLNIQHIIDALKPKQKNKPPTVFDLKVNTIVIRKSQARYDILSVESKKEKIDPNHLHIYDLNADINVPRIKNDYFTVDLKRLTAKEKSGIELNTIKGVFHISSSGSYIKGFEIIMPNSELLLSDIELNYTSWEDLKQNYKSFPINLYIRPGSHISPYDFKGLYPPLKNINKPIEVELFATGNIDSLHIKKLDIATEKDRMWLLCRGMVNNITNPEIASIDFQRINFHGYGQDIVSLLSSLKTISSKDAKTISNLGKTSVKITAKGDYKNIKFTGDISTSPGNAKIDLSCRRYSKNAPLKVFGHISTSEFNIGKLISNPIIGSVGTNAEFSATIANKKIKGSFEGEIPHLQFKNYTYHDIKTYVDIDDNKINGSLTIDDNNINMIIAGEAQLDKKSPTFDIHIDANNISPYNLNILNKYPDHLLSAVIHAEYNGLNFNNATASLSVKDLKYTTSSQEGIIINNINLDIDNNNSPKEIILNSDIIDGNIEGYYNISTLANSVKGMISQYVPTLIKAQTDKIDTSNSALQNEFNFNFKIKDNNTILDFINAPVKFIHPIYISGNFSQPTQKMNLEVDAPYLQQKNKLIKNSRITLDVDKEKELCQFAATTVMPTKKGETLVNLQCNGRNDHIDTKIDWSTDYVKAFKGELMFTSVFQRNEDNSLFTNINIRPSQLIFNDSIWEMKPSHIVINNKDITVSGFDVYRENQYIKLNGKATPNPEDKLCLQLLDVNLDYIFETLAINNVTFGGNATGSFYASNVFSKEPRLETPGLQVDKFSYNYSLLGDAIIESHWDVNKKAVALNADISQSNGCKSYINGEIFPMNDSLDLRFDTQKIEVGFLKPFMSGFAKDVTGYASGKARLWGNFKRIDMTGDLFAENLRLKIDFTNTYYSATDSVHLKPGYIELKNIKLTDDYGNNAYFGGYLKHKFFKDLEFDLKVSNARNILCFDETATRNPIWHGHIFGNGSVSIKGSPGIVSINVKMNTTPNSSFTFVLSEQQVASEYTFITFRDREKKDTIVNSEDDALSKVKQLEQRIAQQRKKDTSKSKCIVDLNVGVNPGANITLVMDPVGGDNIKARGNGQLHLKYDSENENDIFLSGEYIISEGKYNFSLQDIIRKEFIINSESSIKFNGDPYSADLNVDAIYALKANLTDLDESFAQDKDITTTNVPVHAKIFVTGDLRQPNIDFELDFPGSENSNIKNKVNSIISTKEMMNRQMVYLLALNRFYTPEYMSSTTKGNELASVASSTISSQLSNMLGELSENWDISPNFRSDKGDFSDVEVDLALSSRLLNNRLLFNGNFGYRDKTMNENTFVGDFDIEYLLNKNGNIRLKAYNRYNDQNYYLKTANTTQGVGIVFRRDFDKMFNFLNAKKKVEQQQPDSITPTDSIKLETSPIIIPERE